MSSDPSSEAACDSPSNASSTQRPNVPSLGWFGFTIGVLTALSTHAGTTSTLIGLLFALIGGSLVGWYKKSDLSVEQINGIISHASKLAVCLLLGVLLGFAIRFGDRAWVEPWLSKKKPPGYEVKQSRVLEKVAEVQLLLINREHDRIAKDEDIDLKDVEHFDAVLGATLRRSSGSDPDGLLASIAGFASQLGAEKSEPNEPTTLSLQSVKTDSLKDLRDELEDAVNRLGGKQLKSLFEFVDNWYDLRVNAEANSAAISDFRESLSKENQKTLDDRVLPLLNEKK